MISKCNCKHEFQDEEYGKQMRVFNECMKSRMRCSVCGAEKDQNAREEVIKKINQKGKK